MDTAQQQISRDLVATRLVTCACDLLKAQRTDGALDLTVDLTEGDGLPFENYVMDSLGFVQWMAELEEQLEIALMAVADSEEARTLGGLADVVIRDADPERLDAFCERWA